MSGQSHPPLSLDAGLFSQILSSDFACVFDGAQAVAVGVSGGPDSMALCRLLSLWSAAGSELEIHALSVDHGLRAEAADEAQQVGACVEGWPFVTHTILDCDVDADSKVMENARRGRYEVMAAYCAEKNISHLFLAHHQDDQAETFLFRLAKGSGLDGLSAMRRQQIYSNDLVLLRPLLYISKAQLVAFCDENDVSFVHDPSNDSDVYARVRLRQSVDVLAEEGMTAKRLVGTARRLSRAQEALDLWAVKCFDSVCTEKNTKRIVFNFELLCEEPEEIVLRVLLKGIQMLRPEEDYAPRMERVEGLLSDLLDTGQPFRRRTLGGLIFERDDGAGCVIIVQE